ncbi:MAG: diguanylate cyclase, partial [Chloroflexota bacterium]
ALHGIYSGVSDPVQPVLPHAAPARPYRILVADDDPDIRRLVARMLRVAGYAVSTAADGEDALRLARLDPPDLVMLDVSMPGYDGFSVCRSLQEDGRNAPPVIFLTALGSSGDRVEGLDAGAVDYVVKPYDRAELLARVRAALRSKVARDVLATEAATDGLTALLNRRQLGVRAAEAVLLARRHERPLACLMIDLDRFKRVNDTFGHLAGDAVWREVARRLRSVSRATDIAGRYGGEEFTLLLPETGADGAMVVAEKIRQTVAATPVQYVTYVTRDAGPAFPVGTNGSQTPWAIQVSVSLGVACFHPDMVRAEALFAAADEALYRAKALGGDRASLAHIAER